MIFSPQLASRRSGAASAAFGTLASRYVRNSRRSGIVADARWRGLLGSGDIQSLADLGNSYAVVGDMRFVPFGLTNITRLAAATAAPLLPLGLTVLSFEDLVVRIIKIVFRRD